jgi:threonine aldolase
MRRAMADAVVGDDVFGEDPTVRELESEVAGLFGREAALFVPSGTQGNQIAARLHAGPGEEVLVEALSHSMDWELAGLAALSGLQARPLPSVRGVLDPDLVAASLRPAGGFRPACRLVVVENTHNFHGGAVVPIASLRRLRAVARERGAKVHLDGARLWNAAVASGTPLRDYGAVADSILVSLSKGLCAPVGSLLVGDRAFVQRARETRKLFGGGMRQVGVLAAPGLVAVRTMRDRLADDHRRARSLADGFLSTGRARLPAGPVETNIVIVEVEPGRAKAVQDALAAKGVLAIAIPPDRIRFVTHRDVGDAEVARAVEAFHDAVA